jgi:hypothetical protein
MIGVLSVFDGCVDFLSMDRNVFGSGDAKPQLAAGRSDDLNNDVVADANRFANVPCKYQHG